MCLMVVVDLLQYGIDTIMTAVCPDSRGCQLKVIHMCVTAVIPTFNWIQSNHSMISPICVIYNRIALNNLDKAGNYLGTGIRIVFLYYLGGVSQTGKRGFQGEARAQIQSYIVQERNKAVISYLKATTQASDNLRKDTGVTPSVTSHWASTAGRNPRFPW